MSDQNLIIAIPARYASTRLAQKLLKKIGEKTVIVRVVERTLQIVQKIKEQYKLNVVVLVATDNEKIQNILANLNCEVILTSAYLQSGTDRIYEAIKHYEYVNNFIFNDNSLVINIQGDEPFFSKEGVLKLIEKMLNSDNKMGTIIIEKNDVSSFLKANIVKVVLNNKDEAIYFSRSPIPFPRNMVGADNNSLDKLLNSNDNIFKFWQHIGVYAYKLNYLQRFAKELKQGILEQTEGLEQLRAISDGVNLLTVKTTEHALGIDTEEDLINANFIYKQYE